MSLKVCQRCFHSIHKLVVAQYTKSFHNTTYVTQRVTMTSVAFCRLVIWLVVVCAILSSVKMLPIGIRRVVVGACLEVSQDVAD